MGTSMSDYWTCNVAYLDHRPISASTQSMAQAIISTLDIIESIYLTTLAGAFLDASDLELGQLSVQLLGYFSDLTAGLINRIG